MPDINQDFETLLSELSSLSKRDRKMVERHLSDAEKVKIRKAVERISTDRINNGPTNNGKVISEVFQQENVPDINIYSPWLSGRLRDILDADIEQLPKHITKAGKNAILCAITSNDEYFSKNPIRQTSTSQSSRLTFLGRRRTRS